MAPKGGLIDDRVSLKQCKKAVQALHTHETKKQEQLLETELLPGKEPNIWLNVAVKQMPLGAKLKPAKIPIVHPLVDPRTTAVCLITKDPQREYKDLLEKHNIKFISRVVGITKLKGKFKPFEARRMLLKENGLFLADERVIPLLPKLLGVKWFDAKKQPIPVCLTRKDLKGELERAISSTYMNQNKGTCTSIKIGIISQKPAQILANLEMALPAVAKHIQGGWDNIQALHIKTNSSVSLPIWSCKLDDGEGGRWNGLTQEVADEAESEPGSEGEEQVADTKTKQAEQGKGKKRSQEEVEEVEKPKKKVKGQEGRVMEAAGTATNKNASKAQARDSLSKSNKHASATIDAPKLKTCTSESQPPSAAPRTSRDIADKPSSSKEKRMKISAASKSVAPTVERTAESRSAADSSTGVTGTKDHKKTKARFSIGAAAPDVPQDPKVNKKLAVKIKEAPSTSGAKVLPEKPPKKKADVLPVRTARAEKSSLTKDELKQKRSGDPGERKKMKVKSVGGKSAKNGVLGKKIAQ